VAVQRKTSDDGGGNAAALLTYYGFLSLFPLLLLAVAILGFIVQSNSSVEGTLRDSGLPNIPIIGTTLKQGHLTGSGIGVAVGALGALWAGLGITNVLQGAFNQIDGVPYARRPGFLAMRLRGLSLLLAIGSLELITTAATGLVSSGVGGVALDIAGYAITLTLNAALFAVAFRLLSAHETQRPRLWPGIAFATLCWELVQSLGGIFVHHVLARASATYGSFAGVIGLLAWLHLGARAVIYGAELNSVLAGRYWPRSLLEPATAADHAVRRALAIADAPPEDVLSRR
jgi:YihY family inner membrane protein